MVYKHGIKEYIFIAAVYGTCLGLVQGLWRQSVFAGLFIGVMSGVVFSLCMLLFNKIYQRKYDNKRNEISAEREIICDGVAEVNRVGGWLYLTANTLEFYRYKNKETQQYLMLPLNIIKEVETKTINKLLIRTTLGHEVAIKVLKNKQWKDQIYSAIH